MATMCRECNKEVSGVAYYGFCGIECYNKYIGKRNAGVIGYTAMQGSQVQQQSKPRKIINDIITDGKIHATICLTDCNFAIVCDQRIDPAMLAKASAAFQNVFTKNV